MTPIIYGHARVTTDGQSVDPQVRQLRAAGCKVVFREVTSGAKTDRASLAQLVAQLAPDGVMMTRLDRSTPDLLNTLDAITSKEAAFLSLADVWADTTTPHGRLMLTVLGGLEEFEHALIRSQTSEGRERTKAQGKSLARPFKLTTHQEAEAIRWRENGEETLAEIGRSHNVSGATISRLKPCLSG